MELHSTPLHSSSPSLEPTGGSSSTSSESQHLEEVAIVGMACRTSGGVKTPDELWQFLLKKQNGSGTVPSFRWEPWLRRDSRNAKELGKTLDRGYFVSDLENFDAAFFGISPKEAEQMDPHQRLALELAWEALEHAGINPQDLRKSDTAVFMGIDSDDYSRLLMEDIPNIEPWMGIGTAAHGVANRISYHLDLMGPSAAVDAACASSLVAVHNGSQAIQLGESEVALVGGVNVLLAPALTRMLDKTGALSPDGVCRSFDDAANGYARGEGGALLVLKRLSSAIRDGDHIWSTLKGSAVAQDGKTNGIMAPNATAQELVGRQALERAGLSPLSIGYVEAHATSTPLGDPTEVSAIAQLYGRGAGRPVNHPCMIGSIKPNIGHLEAASGAIGLIKAVMIVEKGVLAPQTLLDNPNSRINWASSGLQIVRDAVNWGAHDGLVPRRAAVCSYGYGGTVSHAIIEQHLPSPLHGDSSESILQIVPSSVLIITAVSEKRVLLQAKALAEWLATPAGRSAELRDVATTLAKRRAHHAHRVAIIAKDHDDAVHHLQAIYSQSTRKTDPIVAGRVMSSLNPGGLSPIWIFSGHGAQWSNMGCGLIHNKVFLQAMQEIEGTITREAGFSIIEALETGGFGDTGRAQVATFAMQYGLSRLLRSYGLLPRAVLGHSIGEICASVVAGCITPNEGAFVVARRSKLLSTVKVAGAMALVQLPFSTVKGQLAQRVDVVAAIDASPKSCVVSGEADAVAAYVQQLRDEHVETFKVNSDIAFHSPMLEDIQCRFKSQICEVLKPSPASIQLFSTSLENARDTRLRDADYWVNNMVKPVLLRGAIRAACEDGYRTFLEISSHPIITHSIRETLSACELGERETTIAYTMRRDAPADQTMKLAIAQLFVRGANVDVGAAFVEQHHWCEDVPRTCWSKQPYYRQVETGTMGTAKSHDPESHSLLGSRTAVAGTDMVLFTTILSTESKPFPGDHPLDDTEILPAGVYINTFHRATGSQELLDLQLQVPVSVTKDHKDIQVVVQGDRVTLASATHDAETAKNSKQSWIQHANCRFSSSDSNTESPSSIDLRLIQDRIGVQLPDTFAVDFLATIGVSGIAYPWKVMQHYGNENEMLVKVNMIAGHSTYPWDPSSWAPLIDAATSIGSSIFFTQPSLRIISAIDRVSLYSKEAFPTTIFLHVRPATTERAGVLAADVRILDDTGQPLAELQSMTLSEVEAAEIPGENDINQLVHYIDWVPTKFPETPRTPGHIIIVSTDEDRQQQMRTFLQPIATSIVSVREASDITSKPSVLGILQREPASVVYLPGRLQNACEIAAAAEAHVWETTSILRILVENMIPEKCKLFVMTEGIHKGSATTGLAQGPLVGLARIIASEHPERWGSLVDNDRPDISPVLALLYAHDHDVLRNFDSLPRYAVMRPLPPTLLRPVDANFRPKSDGTYLITGGLGFLGLETAEFLVTKGARRILLISRRRLPPRSTWAGLLAESADIAVTILRIRQIESLGAVIHTLELDISTSSSAQDIHKALDSMQLPPVKGVVHCAGVLEDSLALETSQESFRRVMSPKVRGALALHEAFPPGTLDFFVLYSSIGQLVGTAGQASYGAGNAFLDALAAFRRSRQDNSFAMQMTALRGEAGMGASNDFLKVELQSKGITDISAQEAFMAWEHLWKYDIASAVVTRCLTIDEGDDVAVPMLEEVVRRRPRATKDEDHGDYNKAAVTSAATDANRRPSDPAMLRIWIERNLRRCIATVLMMPEPSEIDGDLTVDELGIDSVMTVTLRKHLKDALGIKVPPTLTWKHPTVNSMVSWFQTKLDQE